MNFKFVQHKIWMALIISGFWLAVTVCCQAGSAVILSPVVDEPAEGLMRVKVYRLVVDPASQQPVVTLTDSDEKRAFPIWIGLAEARAIHSELEGMEHFRPLTHDLLASIIEKVDGKIQRVVITHVQDNVFYAMLIIEQDGSQIEIDARPSDSIVMALKFDVPIYVTKSLFDKMSIPMEAPKAVGDDYGFAIQEISAELAKYLSLESNRGVMISAVQSGSQAQKDGIQLGDILFEIDGQLIDGVISAKNLMKKSKGPVKAKIIRDTQIMSITLQLR